MTYGKIFVAVNDCICILMWMQMKSCQEANYFLPDC